MAKPGLRKIYRYSEAFRLSAVKLSMMPGVMVQSVAAALDIHPFMLSRWRAQYQEVVMRKKIPVDVPLADQLRELRQLKRDYARLQEEHELLKKAIRFSSGQKAKSSNLSKPRGKGIGSK